VVNPRRVEGICLFVIASIGAEVAGLFSPTTVWHAKSFEVGSAACWNQTATRVRLDLHVWPFQEPTVLRRLTQDDEGRRGRQDLRIRRRRASVRGITWNAEPAVWFKRKMFSTRRRHDQPIAPIPLSSFLLLPNALDQSPIYGCRHCWQNHSWLRHPTPQRTSSRPEKPVERLNLRWDTACAIFQIQLELGGIWCEAAVERASWRWFRFPRESGAVKPELERCLWNSLVSEESVLTDEPD